jgi:hypothetical protein
MASPASFSSYRNSALTATDGIAASSGVAGVKLESRFSLLDDTDDLISRIKVPKISDLSFEVDGIPLHARNRPDDGLDKIVIWATLGYLPYSITSREKRHALIHIMENSCRLPNIKIGIAQDMKIVVTATYPVEVPPTPNYIFEPVIRFIQESRPFIRLIGEYL